MLINTKQAAELTGLSEYELRYGFKRGLYPALGDWARQSSQVAALGSGYPPAGDPRRDAHAAGRQRQRLHVYEVMGVGKQTNVRAGRNRH